jgi:hypothetical protein
VPNEPLMRVYIACFGECACGTVGRPELQKMYYCHASHKNSILCSKARRVGPGISSTVEQ